MNTERPESTRPTPGLAGPSTGISLQIVRVCSPHGVRDPPNLGGSVRALWWRRAAHNRCSAAMEDRRPAWFARRLGDREAGTGRLGCDRGGRGVDEGHRVRGRLVLLGSGGDLGGEAWLVVGGQPRVLMMIRLLASAVAGGSPSTTTAVPLGMPVWKRRDRATWSETTKWVSTLPWEGAGNSAL